MQVAETTSQELGGHANGEAVTTAMAMATATATAVVTQHVNGGVGVARDVAKDGASEMERKTSSERKLKTPVDWEIPRKTLHTSIGS